VVVVEHHQRALLQIVAALEVVAMVTLIRPPVLAHLVKVMQVAQALTAAAAAAVEQVVPDKTATFVDLRLVATVVLDCSHL